MGVVGYTKLPQMGRAAPGVGFCHHFHEVGRNTFVSSVEGIVILLSDMATIQSEVEPDLCLSGFSVGVAEFADEMRWIAALSPSFGNVGADRS